MGSPAGAPPDGRTSVRGRADLFGLTSDEGGSVLDDDASRAEVADKLGGGLELDALGGVDIALHRAVDDDRLRFHFALHVGAFAHGERGVRADFAFDFAVENEVVLEFQGSFDFNVAGKMVAVAGG